MKIKIYKTYELMNTNYHPLSANITLPKILLILLITIIIIIVIIIMFYYCNYYYYYYFVIIILVMIVIIIIIQYQYLGNCPPTPPLT